MLVLFIWKVARETLPNVRRSALSYVSPTLCIQNKKKIALTRKHFAKLQSSLLSSLGLDSHQSRSLSLQKWNCTYFRNRNYAGFCEPFFPISDLWICGMTPATRIITSNCCIQSIIFMRTGVLISP